MRDATRYACAPGSGVGKDGDDDEDEEDEGEDEGGEDEGEDGDEIDAAVEVDIAVADDDVDNEAPELDDANGDEEEEGDGAEDEDRDELGATAVEDNKDEAAEEEASACVEVKEDVVADEDVEVSAMDEDDDEDGDEDGDEDEDEDEDEDAAGTADERSCSSWRIVDCTCVEDTLKWRVYSATKFACTLFRQLRQLSYVRYESLRSLCNRKKKYIYISVSKISNTNQIQNAHTHRSNDEKACGLALVAHRQL